MSLNRFAASGGGGGGTQDVDIVGQTGADPLNVLVDDTTPVKVEINTPVPVPVSQSGQIVIDDSTPVDVAVTNAVTIDDSTPIDVNMVSPDPVNVVFDNPETQLTLNKGNMTSLGGGRYAFPLTLGDIARFPNIFVRYNIDTPVTNVNVATQIFDTVGDGRLTPISPTVDNTMGNAAPNQVSHKFVTRNNFQTASNVITNPFTPFTNAANFWQISSSNSVDRVVTTLGFNSECVMYITINVTGADPDFTLYADIAHLDA